MEALRPLLPKRQAKRWAQQATALQTGLGVHRRLGEFFRGVAVGQQRDALPPTAPAKAS